MATVKELKEWLNKFPDETIVKVTIRDESKGYESFGEVKFYPLELEGIEYGKGWEFVDYTNNPYMQEGDSCYGQKYLLLGEQS